MSKPKKMPQSRVSEQERARKAAKRRRKWSYAKRGAGTVFAAFFAILFLMPIVLTITNSFMSASEISSNYGMVFATTSSGGKVYIAEKVTLKFIPDMVSFSQYVTVLFKSPEYLFKFWNSVILVGPIVVFQLTVASLASYGFARYRGRIREIIFFAYIILMLMPYQVTLVPNYLVSDWLHILDTRWAIWLPGIFSPFAVFLLTKFMRRIPTSLVEAAQIDGAGSLGTFFYVGIPLGVPGIFSILILGFLEYWNAIEQPMTYLKTEALWPLSLYLPQMVNTEITAAFAASIVTLLPAVLIFFYGQDSLEQGIVASCISLH